MNNNQIELKSNFSKTIQITEFCPESVSHSMTKTIPADYPQNRRIYEMTVMGLELEQAAIMQFAAKGTISAEIFDESMRRIINTKKSARELLRIQSVSLVVVRDGEVQDCVLFESEEKLANYFEDLTGVNYNEFKEGTAILPHEFAGTKVFKQTWHSDPSKEEDIYI